MDGLLMASRLINASKSRRGNSRIGTFIGCEYKLGAQQRGAITIGSGPLCKGSLGHTAQAHLHTHESVASLGSVVVNNEFIDDASDFLDPLSAMAADAQVNPEYMDYLGLMTQVFLGYKQQRDTSVLPVTHVEVELAGCLGMVNDKFGFWLVDPDYEKYLSPDTSPTPDAPPELVRHFDGSIIEPLMLDMEGHKEHGWPIWMTRRLDAVRQADKWKPEERLVEDHKHQARLSSSSDMLKYQQDFGFVAIELLARQRFRGCFRGTMLNLICTDPKLAGKQKRMALPPTSNSQLFFARNLWYREQQLAMLEVMADIDEMPRSIWPRRQLEVGTPCRTVYGSCELHRHCHNGEPLRFKS